MSGTIAKYVIITLIIGLIIGFFGGYSYQNLNASAPATTKIASAIPVSEPISAIAEVAFQSGEGDESGDLGNILMAAIGNSIVESVKANGNGSLEEGIQKVTGTSASTSYLPQQLVESALDRIFPPAQAQGSIIKEGADIINNVFGKGTAKCDAETLGRAITSTKQWYDRWVKANVFKDAPCVEKLSIEAPVNNRNQKQNNLKVTVYQKMEGLKTITFFGFELSGTAKAIYQGIDESDPGRPCKAGLETGVHVAKRGGITVTTGPGKNPPPAFDVNNSPGDGFRKLCRADAVFEHVVVNEGYKPSEKDCCDKTGETGGGNN